MLRAFRRVAVRDRRSMCYHRETTSQAISNATWW